MKIIIRLAITVYSYLFASPVATCRFRPTCSQYTLQAIQKHGVLKGSLLSLKRLVACHPFSKRSLYDPV